MDRSDNVLMKWEGGKMTTKTITEIKVYWDNSVRRQGWAWVCHPNGTPDSDTCSGGIDLPPWVSDDKLAHEVRGEFGGDAEVVIDRSDVPADCWHYYTGFESGKPVGHITGYFATRDAAMEDAEKSGWLDEPHLIVEPAIEVLNED